MKKKTGLAEKGKAWRIATYVLLLFMILIAVVSGDLDAVYGDQIPGGALRHAAGNYSG